MAKIENLIQESLKERLQEVASKPKRRRLGKQIIASSNEELESKCKQLRRFEYKEMQEKPCIPVLFLFGQARKVLKQTEVATYTAIGARVEKLTLEEVKRIFK